MTPLAPSPKLLTIAEVAEVLRLQYPRAADLIRRSVIPAIRIGRQVRVSPEALNAFIEGGGYKLRRRLTAGRAMNTGLGAFNADEISAYCAARVPRLKQRGEDEWRGQGPIHEGRGDNFAVQRKSGCWFCHSTCARGGDILDLEGELGSGDFAARKAEVLSVVGRRSFEAPRNAGGKRREVDRCEYLDRARDLRFEVLRYLNADGSKRFSHRTIREEPKFDEQRAKLGVSHKRLDEVLAAFHYALCRDPERYPRVPGTTLRVLKTSVYPGAPSLRIFFTFDEHEVHLIMIEFCDEGIPPAFIVEDD